MSEPFSRSREPERERKLAKPVYPEQELALNPELNGFLEAVEAVVRERRAMMEGIREALVDGNEMRALALARELVGLTKSEREHEKGD